ncbi:MAG: aldo/keto reductase [Candidatus Latescibacteria bacterium]|jgi:D-threo-aldose 1-dehydrogenase|nr:pyridoxal 4-dehydrogenase [Gemmatimonadaceae bacterium]MDP6014609.1 aldo/keto reductase [Candidatus Latescibacterota bacterium]MDP7447934.1 aldo/keto reductase [Candidatus Latescibacterota bacterium]HJP30145.1 aldo/keto reductase [Candidatus Latescibacterota bacterium]|tara:strand:+ start:1527 stop:2546 length:1020 start_codon:yes stop_codon:yes gene_type:complete
MKAPSKRRLGETDVEVSEFGFGGAPLGELFVTVPEPQAQATLSAAWDGGIRYYDTAPFYGYGQSEHRIGHFLRQQSRDDFILSTKIGRVLTPTRDLTSFDRGVWAGGLPFDFYYDYSYDGVMRSWENSIQRLGLASIDLLLIHDLDQFFWQDVQLSAYEQQLRASGWRALEELKQDGRIRAIGAGINVSSAIPRLLNLVDLDFFIVAMPYTLLDQAVLDEEFPLCQERGVGIVLGSPFASGILVTGPVEGARYAYGIASEDILEKTRRIQAVCERHEVALPCAAIHFALAHPSVAAIIPGGFQPDHVQQNLAAYGRSIPSDLWAELKAEGLLRADAPTP